VKASPFARRAGLRLALTGWPLQSQLLLLLTATTGLALFVADRALVGSGAAAPPGLWLAVAGTGLACMGTAGLWLRGTRASLARLMQAADRMGEPGVAGPPQTSSSQELQGLNNALCAASARWREQREGLDAAQARTLAIVNAVPDVILGLEADGRIGLVNPSVTSVFGLPPEEVRGLPLQAVLPGIDRREVEQRTLNGLFMRATRTHVARFETNARRQDGTEFPVEVSVSRIETDGDARYAAVVRDVTEQRMTFSMLNLYSRALECTSNGVVISDMSLPGRPVFYANPAFQDITGYAPSEVIGRNCGLLQRDDRDQPNLAVLRDALAAGRPTQVVLRNYRKDGTLFFNELSVAPVAAADGSVPHYVGVLNDVTERERSRMAIAERSARLNAVFDLSPDGFVVFNRDSRMAYVNRAFQAMTGWSGLMGAQEGLSLEEFDEKFRGLCDRTLPYVTLQELLADAGETAEAGNAATAGADTLTLVAPERRMLARAVRGRAQGHDETFVFFRDITRETEVDRMKSEFLTTAAHELRTPMVSVFGFTELLLRRPVPEERRRDMLETIHRQASLLINMVNELLDLARIEARQGKDLKREPCRLDSLVKQAVGPLVGAGGSHRFELDIPHGEQLLWVDPEKTHRALVNVLSNAMKYSPQGGAIQIRTYDGRVRGAPAVGVQVMDKGIGMTPEQLARVCERFYRADPSGNIPGTGLGMSLVKEIVELQGGRVDLASQPECGTTVTLWLPLSTSTTEA
jgi:PAS domain S-box-containing protein